MLGTTLTGRYRIDRHLSSGGFGETHVAQDMYLPGHPYCVIKQLKTQLTDTVNLEAARHLFEREAQVLYKLGDHPQIPRLLAHFEENQEFYLVQDYIDGQDLSHELILGTRFKEAYVIKLLEDILEVLEFVHQQGVIHRDIKPSNLIRRQSDGKVVLIDFGAVKQLSVQAEVQKHTTRTIAIGTPGYTPSEQSAGKPRLSSDIYAVGMLAIQALTGLFPKDIPEDPRTGEVRWHDLAKVTPGLAAVIDKMVLFDCRQRYEIAAEALQALRQRQQLVGVQIRTAAVPPTQAAQPISPAQAEPVIFQPTPTLHPVQPEPDCQEKAAQRLQPLPEPDCQEKAALRSQPEADCKDKAARANTLNKILMATVILLLGVIGGGVSTIYLKYSLDEKPTVAPTNNPASVPPADAPKGKTQ
jgi:serine/threonine-protein kinase